MHKPSSQLDGTRLSPEQFKAVVAAKGWTYRELATRWGVSSVWISNVARNPERAAHYDDAVLGLPSRRHLRRNEKRRQALVDALVRKHAGERPTTGAYRYHGALSVGSIVTAAEEVGSIAEEGMRGIVFQVEDHGAGEKYGIIFETGLWDWFQPEHVDQCLAETGLIDQGSKGYQFRSEGELARDFAEHKFSFWTT